MKRTIRLTHVMRGILGALVVMPLSLVGGITAVAAEQPSSSARVPQPLAAFNFDTPAVSGKYTDPATGAQAIVNGTEDLVDSEEGQGKAAHLSKQFWLDLKNKNGTSPLKGCSAITISYDSKPDPTNNIGWTIYGVQSASFNPAGNETYLGIMDKVGSVRVERYANGRNGDAATIDEPTNTGSNWKHVDLVIDGTTARLYVNKTLLATNTKGVTLQQMLTASGGILRVGRANWGTGEYYSGLIDNIKIYGSALTDRQLGLVDPTAVTISGDNVKNHALSVEQGTIFDLTATLAPHVGALPGISWSSSDSAVISSRGNGTFAALKNGTATITAASTVKPSISDSLTVTVEKSSVKPTDPYGYVMVHFKEDSAGYKEKIFLDISQGDNPQRWDPLNGGEPILANNESTTGVRDPFIAHNPQTGTFYLLATDLRVFGGDNAQWGTWTNNYSTKLHVWSTKDFIHFSKMRSLETTAGADGIAKSTLTDTKTGSVINNLGMAWAPEATWVPNFYDLNDDGVANNSAKGGAFVLYWSANPSINGANRHNTVMWGYTTDFTQKTFHFGGVFINTGGNTIDTTMLQRRVEGTQADGNPLMRTYRVTKDNSFGNGIYMETTNSQDWWNPNDTTWRTTQTKIGAMWAGGNAGGVEGPASFVDHSSRDVNGNAHKWYLYVDVIPSTGYRPMVSTDLDGTTPWKQLALNDFYMAPHTKHGGVVSLTKAQYDEIRSADASAKDNKNLTAPAITVQQNSNKKDILAKLPKTEKITTAYGLGISERPVTWNLSKVTTSKTGMQTITGTVDTIGANLNHWKWTDATGQVRTDLDDLSNTANANNSWKQSGGMNVTDANASQERPLYSSTAITLSARVTVSAKPITPPSVSPSVDKTGLVDEVVKAGKADLAGYTSSSAKRLSDALSAARAVLSDSSASQSDVDAALKALRAAFSYLVSCPVPSFRDVAAGDWFYPAVRYVNCRGVMKGYGRDRRLFGPADRVTREQAALVLYRWAGSPSVSGRLRYRDARRVSPWARDAVLWASRVRLMNGYGRLNVFGPQDGLTRSQAAALVARASGRDIRSLSSAMDWAVSHRVINGWPDWRRLDPDGVVDRAQMAQILSNAIQKGVIKQEK